MSFHFCFGHNRRRYCRRRLETGRTGLRHERQPEAPLPAIRRELLEAKQRKETEQLEKEIQRLQKFEGTGRLAGGVAHDFNNALGVIVGWAQLGYERAPMESSFRDMYEKIRDQAQRSAGLTTQLLAFSRRQVLQPRNLDLNTLVSETLSLLRSVMGSPVEIIFTPGKEPVVVLADPTQIEQVLDQSLSECARCHAAGWTPDGRD